MTEKNYVNRVVHFCLDTFTVHMLSIFSGYVFLKELFLINHFEVILGKKTTKNDSNMIMTDNFSSLTNEISSRIK